MTLSMQPSEMMVFVGIASPKMMWFRRTSCNPSVEKPARVSAMAANAESLGPKIAVEICREGVDCQYSSLHDQSVQQKIIDEGSDLLIGALLSRVDSLPVSMMASIRVA